MTDARGRLRRRDDSPFRLDAPVPRRKAPDAGIPMTEDDYWGTAGVRASLVPLLRGGQWLSLSLFRGDYQLSSLWLRLADLDGDVDAINVGANPRRAARGGSAAALAMSANLISLFTFEVDQKGIKLSTIVFGAGLCGLHPDETTEEPFYPRSCEASYARPEWAPGRPAASAASVFWIGDACAPSKPEPASAPSEPEPASAPSEPEPASAPSEPEPAKAKKKKKPFRRKAKKAAPAPPASPRWK